MEANQDAGSDQVAQQVAAYSWWNSTLTDIAGLVRNTAALYPTTAKDSSSIEAVERCCHDFYESLLAVSQPVADVLAGLKQAPPRMPKFTLRADALPVMPATPDSGSLHDIWNPLVGSWELFKEVAEIALAGLRNPSSELPPLAIAAGGLLQTGDRDMQTLAQLLRDSINRDAGK